MLKEIFNRIANDKVKKEDIITLLELEDDKQINELFKEADKVREANVGPEVHLRGIIEFSNYCKQHCLYCGLQNQNKKINRYRIEPDDIIQIAKDSLPFEYKTIVLQSGEDDYFTDEKMCYIIREIKKLGYAVTVSIGEKTFEQFKKYREAGADRYLLKQETINRNLYNYLNPAMSLQNRIRCHIDLKALGFQVGSGIMVGLPNQTIDNIADDIMHFHKMDYDMLGIGPFIPHHDTALKNSKITQLKFVKKVVAITRLVMKDILLPVTTAFSTLNNDTGREEMLQCGANVVMPNITPVKFKKEYTIYPNKACLDEEAYQCKGCLGGRIASIGRSISKGYGHREKSQNP